MKQTDLFGNVVVTDPLLRDKFIEPPFSILDTKSGNWQRRKNMWKKIGILGEIGRSTSTIRIKGGNPNNKTEKKDISKTPYLSIFDPALCEVLYHWFCPDGGTILDPFAGGSVRGIVANYLGYKYTGIDIRQEQIDSNREQGLNILAVNNQPNWYVGDSNKVLNDFGVVATPKIVTNAHVVVEKCTKEDVNPCVNIIRHYFNKGIMGIMPIVAYYDSVEKGHLYKIEDENDIIGVMDLKVLKRTSHLRINQICKKDRELTENKRFFIGSTFLKYAMDYYKRNELKYIELFVCKHNEKAIKFYEEHGFKITGENGERDYRMVYEENGLFDFVFSCPPYADLEVYSDLKGDISNMPYDDFMKVYKEIIAKSCNLLKNGGYACFVVGEVRNKKGNYIGFVPDTINAFRNCGMNYYNEGILLSTIASASMRANGNMKTGKLVKVHQNILIFKKIQ